MQTRGEWRVACVRIPRFPIGAVSRVSRELESGDAGVAQLLLNLEKSAEGAEPEEACCSSAEPH